MNSSSEKGPFSLMFLRRGGEFLSKPMATTTEEDAAADCGGVAATTDAFLAFFSKSYHHPWSSRTRPRDPSHWHCVGFCGVGFVSIGKSIGMCSTFHRTKEERRS
jgi:hypothetical protein